MENEQTAAQLLEARAEADERIKDRVAFLKTRIDSDRAELATLGIKRVRVEKPKRGRPKGSRNIQISEPLRSVVNSIIPAGIHESAERAKTEHILSDIEKQTRSEFAPNAATEEGL